MTKPNLTHRMLIPQFVMDKKICFYFVNQIPEKRADVKIKCERDKCTIFKEISEKRKRWVPYALQLLTNQVFFNM